MSHLTKMSDVRSEKVLWLWPGRIPLGKLTVLDGDPDLGKSLITIDLAARVSRGWCMPDCEQGHISGPANVLMLSAEDDKKDTIRPRLDAAGADVTRVHLLEPDVSPSGITLLTIDDINPFTIAQADARLVIVDPIMAFMPDSSDTHVDSQVRKVLARLAYTAQETGVAILVIRHLNKKSDVGKSMYRGGGSIAFIASARSGLIVAAEDANDPNNNRCVLASTKSNLSMKPPTIGYIVERVGDDLARVKWHGEVQCNIDLLLREPDEGHSAIGEAKDFLTDILSSGSVDTKIIHQKAKELGITIPTLRRAKDMVGVEAKKMGFGKDGSWQWSLNHKSGSLKEDIERMQAWKASSRTT